METTKFNLTEGGILKKLLLVAVPIMGTQVIQMAYNLTDMFWLGRVGSEAVAASGTVGMYLWLSMAFLMLGRMGAEIGVSQNIGRGDRATAQAYAQDALTLNAGLGLAYGIFLVVLTVPLVSFFQIQEAVVVSGAQQYLRIVGIGVPFSFTTAAITGMFNGSGNSRLPFLINCIGLGLNMVLDPVLIFGANMGVGGAALATILAQITACICSLLAVTRSKTRPFAHLQFFKKPSAQRVKQILAWATPAAVQSFLFAFMSMLLSRMIAAYSAEAMAAQRISTQVESLAWLIGGGFSSALTALSAKTMEQASGSVFIKASL